MSPTRNDSHERLMREALVEAGKALNEGEVPIGAVAVRDGMVVARGHNRRRGLKDITAHAEIMCLRDLSPALENLDLDGITIYSTLEPCAMCAGAMLHYGVREVVYGARDLKLGADGTACEILSNGRIQVVRGILDVECREILYGFFEKELGRRSKCWEDIALE